MHISKIELENIKSHVSSTYEFSCGTTAISGENGAGKTTIIEAIAWAMFDLLEYKKEDFVRRGAKKGSVTVSFFSGLDEREYVVYRDTGTGYHVMDPRLQTRVAVKKEEVFRFLWQHLVLEPGTDLRSLFRQAIGVPQGTFTAIFLEGATERKIAFDRLLKVEEYRLAAEKLRETGRHLDVSVACSRENIARSEGELSRSAVVEQEHKSYSERSKTLSDEITALGRDLAGKQSLVKELDAKEQRASALQAALTRLKAELEKAELILDQRDQSVKQAAEASARIDQVRTRSIRHLAVLGRLGEMERERHERDRFRTQLAAIEAAIVNVNADQRRLSRDLETVQNAHRDIESLRPKAARQQDLEKTLPDFRERLAPANAFRAQIKSLDDRLERLREEYKTNHDTLTKAERKASAAAHLAALEQRDRELLRDLANLRASLDRDEKFQREIKNGLCPILSQVCLNLKEGETLETFVASQFTGLRSQIATVEGQHLKVIGDLNLARDAAGRAAALESYRRREQEMKDEGTRYNAEKTDLEKQLEVLIAAEPELAALESELKALEDPAAQIRFLKKETRREMEFREALSKTESNFERLESERRLMVEQMEAYKDLDEQWATLTSERDATVEAHRVLLANEAAAGSLQERQAELERAKADLSSIALKAAAAERELADAGADYDREAHTAEKAALLIAEKLFVQTSSRLEAAKLREEQLAAELARFAELKTALAREYREKERLEKVAEATSFIRDTLKEAAPRVARNYVYHVSIEAAQMYRQITGNAECTLRWAEDYSINLEEDGYERPFQSLSGGEQMAAALSVRLAWLKQLTDIRIAFFDEPTTNLDAERRENLAMHISRITHFDQLFVVSHDETFDNFVDHVIAVGG